MAMAAKTLEDLAKGFQDKVSWPVSLFGNEHQLLRISDLMTKIFHNYFKPLNATSSQ